MGDWNSKDWKIVDNQKTWEVENAGLDIEKLRTKSQGVNSQNWKMMDNVRTFQHKFSAK